MSKTINCTNPSCNNLIPVPDGAMQVICDNCNTWHFPPADSSQGSTFDEPSNPTPSIPPPDNGYLPPDMPVPPSLPDDGDDQNRRGWEQEPVRPHEDLPDNQPNKIAAYLVTDTGERLAIKEGVNVIGRKNADLIIEDQTVSRRHCVIEASQTNYGYEFFVYDVGHLEGNASTNGVFVSGRTLRLQDYERLPLANGTALQIGKVSLTLQTT